LDSGKFPGDAALDGLEVARDVSDVQRLVGGGIFELGEFGERDRLCMESARSFSRAPCAMRRFTSAGDDGCSPFSLIPLARSATPICPRSSVLTARFAFFVSLERGTAAPSAKGGDVGGKGELEDCSWLFFDDEPPDGELASEPKIAPHGDGVDAER